VKGGPQARASTTPARATLAHPLMAELEPSSGLLDPGRARRRPEDDEGPFACLLDSA